MASDLRNELQCCHLSCSGERREARERLASRSQTSVRVNAAVRIILLKNQPVWGPHASATGGGRSRGLCQGRWSGWQPGRRGVLGAGRLGASCPNSLGCGIFPSSSRGDVGSVLGDAAGPRALGAECLLPLSGGPGWAPAELCAAPACSWNKVSGCRTRAWDQLPSACVEVACCQVLWFGLSSLQSSTWTWKQVRPSAQSVSPCCQVS